MCPEFPIHGLTRLLVATDFRDRVLLKTVRIGIVSKQRFGLSDIGYANYPLGVNVPRVARLRDEQAGWKPCVRSAPSEKCVCGATSQGFWHGGKSGGTE